MARPSGAAERKARLLTARPVGEPQGAQSIAEVQLELQPKRPSPALRVFQSAQRALSAAVEENSDVPALLAERRLPAPYR